nr:RNaseH domain-containing protein [Nostoc sp. KVJ3]
MCIKTQHVGDLTENLEIQNFSEAKKTYQQQRPALLVERINQITAFLPQTKELSGALIEIRRKPPISEADPKLAWRIGAMKTGYLNQHIHRITTQTDVEKLKKSGLEPVKRAVSDLLRQFGILPDTALIDSKKDGIDPDVWLTCFYVLRRTRKTNAENIPKTVVLTIRVNPITAKVELTTPDLFNKQGWVSYPVGLGHLSDEDWNPNSFDESNEEVDDAQKRHEQTQEQRLINKFVAECLHECLNTPITDKNPPRVLFMAEAQNSRKMLNWLQNQNLLTNDPLETLKQHLSQEQINRLWVVRLRVADNGEVPVAIVKDSPGSRTSGVYRWQGVCDDGERSLYLSVRKPLNTEQGTKILQQKQSRLDSGSRQAGKARILEIVLIHHPEIPGDKLARFVHSLRSRWPYFANDVVLPLPFPFAIKAKEYAVSTKDPVESSETDDSNL